MAVKYEMEIEITSDGTIKIVTHGVKGPECEAEVKPLEKALGGDSNKSRTKEYYERARQTSKVTEKAK